MMLFVVVDFRMIVALGAFQIGPQKDAADVPCDLVDVSLPIQIKPGGSALLRIAAVSGENLLRDPVPRLILGERLSQKRFPFGCGHVFQRQPAHQHHVEHPLHMPGILRTCQQTLDEL